MYSAKLLLYTWFLCFHVIITTIFPWYFSYLLQGKHRAGPVVETYKTRGKCSCFCWCVSTWFSVGFLGMDLFPDKLLMERCLLWNGKSLLQRKHSVHAFKTFTDVWVKLHIPFSSTDTFWGCTWLPGGPHKVPLLFQSHSSACAEQCSSAAVTLQQPGARQSWCWTWAVDCGGAV